MWGVGWGRVSVKKKTHKQLRSVVTSNHTIIRAAFVRLFVPLLLRDPLTDLRQTWWVYVGGPWNCP